ncbi:hypothetical protein C8J56DRAFT_1030957 [Mycena floridula]|nr:hypothetical protein C8J56DRAFT_1030957 [Mycena floridula]
MGTEIMVYFAARQFFAARRFTKESKKHKLSRARILLLDGWIRLAWRKPYHDSSRVVIGLIQDSDDGQAYLRDIRSVTEDEIKDKSKGDALSKGLAFLQVLWFITQCVGGQLQRLPITALEIVCKYPLSLPLDATVVSPSKTDFYDQLLAGPIFGHHATSPSNRHLFHCIIFELLLGSIFGGIHCIGWNVEFPYSLFIGYLELQTLPIENVSIPLRSCNSLCFSSTFAGARDSNADGSSLEFAGLGIFYDKIYWAEWRMRRKRKVEFGTPLELLALENGKFASLVNESMDRDTLKAMVKNRSWQVGNSFWTLSGRRENLRQSLHLDRKGPKHCHKKWVKTDPTSMCRFCGDQYHEARDSMYQPIKAD